MYAHTLRRTIALVTSAQSTTSSDAPVGGERVQRCDTIARDTLHLLRHERELLDELQRRAATLTATELRMRLAACRHRVEELDRLLP